MGKKAFIMDKNDKGLCFLFYIRKKESTLKLSTI